MNRRYVELDSIRGLAAFTVVIFHGLNVTGVMAELPPMVLRSPLRVLWEGPQAVILFFILSGFVLFLPFSTSKPIAYSSFLIKRICRIYIPYLIAVSIAVIAKAFWSNGEIAGVWGGGIEWIDIVNHVLLLGMFNQGVFNPVVWSLVHEMRISIIFPLIVLLVLKFSWRVNLAIGLVLSCIAIFLHSLFQQRIDPLTNYFDTLHYVLMFLVGAILAKFRSEVTAFIGSKGKTLQMATLAFGFMLYAYSNAIDGGVVAKMLSHWVTAVGGAIFIAMALCSGAVSRVLLKKPVLFIGKISYSLYLYHIVIFLVVMVQFAATLPIWLIWCISLAGTLIVSFSAYHLIEHPSMKVGKYLTTKVKYRAPGIHQSTNA